MRVEHGDSIADSADDPLARLTEGNVRFLRGKPRRLLTSKAVLADLAHAQRPYAAILGCSGTRVRPGLLFDAGFGDLCIIRVAGNVISSAALGSIPRA